jgi:hypothetical protein
MKIRKIEVKNFRNYQDFSFENFAIPNGESGSGFCG